MQHRDGLPLVATGIARSVGVRAELAVATRTFTHAHADLLAGSGCSYAVDGDAPAVGTFRSPYAGQVAIVRVPAHVAMRRPAGALGARGVDAVLLRNALSFARAVGAVLRAMARSVWPGGRTGRDVS
jgi:hypothetical protein